MCYGVWSVPVSAESEANMPLDTVDIQDGVADLTESVKALNEDIAVTISDICVPLDGVWKELCELRQTIYNLDCTIREVLRR